jgi:hypothetical protein
MLLFWRQFFFGRSFFKGDVPTVGTVPSTLNLLISQHCGDWFVGKSLL